MKKALSVFLTLTILAGLCGCASSKYSEAKKLMASYNYAEAKEILLEISDYEDSGELIRECDYRIAKNLMQHNEYAAAREILFEISDYGDSGELIRDCGYNIAKDMMKQDEYSAAKDILLEISDYENSKDLAQECDYNIAIKLMENREYAEAKDILLQISEFKDSKNLAKECELKALYYDQLVGNWIGANLIIDDRVESLTNSHLELYEDFTYTIDFLGLVNQSGKCYFPFSEAESYSDILKFDQDDNMSAKLFDDYLIVSFNKAGTYGAKYVRSDS